MKKKICTITVCIMMILTIMPTGVSAETNDWTYDASNRTLTSAGQNITLCNVRATGNYLCIGSNIEKSFKAIDLTGKINGGRYIITELESETFKNCKSLEDVRLPNTVKEIGSGAFAYCSSLKSFDIPDGVEDIASQTFLECRSLSSVKIPDSVEKIGNTAFANCKALTSIELPAHISNIGDYAFGGCSNLKTVVIDAVFPPMTGQEIFKSLPDDFRIIVPKEGISRYRSYTGWNSYNDRLMISQVGTGSTDHDCEGEDCTICGTQDPGSVCKIIKGENSTWQKGTKDGLSFTSNAAYDDFLKVQVDGKDLDPSNYKVKEGSTIVTLKSSYLETLSAGKHDLAIVSETGTATTEFTVKGAAAGNTDRSAETGDELNILFFAVFAALAAAGVVGVVICGRRREHDM